MISFNDLKVANPKELTDKLIQVAIKGEHYGVEFAGSYQEYCTIKTFRKILKKIITGFKNAADQVLKEYLENLKYKGIDDAKAFPVYKTYKYCENFFKQDKKILEDIMSEYKAYMVKKGYLACYFNEVVRTPEERQIDFRTGKKSPYTALALAESALESFDDIFKKEI